MLALFRIEVSRETSKYLVIILMKASQDNPIGLSNCRCPIVNLHLTLRL